jgi:hypothetical protein
MFEATDEDAITICNPSTSSRAVHIVKGQLEPRKEEEVEHVNCFADRKVEFTDCSREEEDGFTTLLLLLRPRPVKAGVSSEISDGLVMRKRKKRLTTDCDTVSSNVCRCDCRAVRSPTNKFTLEGIELHPIESHEVLYPCVLHT